LRGVGSGGCAIAQIHAGRDFDRGGVCSCIHCEGECDCDDQFDDDELGIDPEEHYDYQD